ncbi:autophagy-related protein 9, partial [Klebsiella pneumoniae]|nr:autophagy-related protein 9 [Klebsiella pneumoniae]
IRGSHTLHEILINRCTAKMSTLSTLFLWLVTFSWFQRLFRYAVDLRRLKHLHDFFYYLLGISNNEIQTISWQDVVSRLMALRDANPATAQ